MLNKINGNHISFLKTAGLVVTVAAMLVGGTAYVVTASNTTGFNHQIMQRMERKMDQGFQLIKDRMDRLEDQIERLKQTRR